MAKAPCSRGRTVATASVGDLPRSTSRATRWATTSLSVSLRNVRPSAISSSRSGLKFSMMPLWTSATGPAMCGWALSDRRRAMRCPARVGDAGIAVQLGSRPVRAPDCRAFPRPGAARTRRSARCRCRPSHSRDIRAASDRRTGAAPPLPGRRSRQFHTCYFLSFFACWRARKRAAQPAKPRCSPRAMTSSSAATFLVTTDPAPTIAPSPMLTGATKRAVRADEGAGADLGPILAEAVVIAGDGARRRCWPSRRPTRRRCS